MTPPNMAGLTATSPAFAEYARLSSAEALKAALESLDLDPSTPGEVIERATNQPLGQAVRDLLRRDALGLHDVRWEGEPRAQGACRWQARQGSPGAR